MIRRLRNPSMQRLTRQVRRHGGGRSGALPHAAGLPTIGMDLLPPNRPPTCQVAQCKCPFEIVTSELLIWELGFAGGIWTGVR